MKFVEFLLNEWILKSAKIPFIVIAIVVCVLVIIAIVMSANQIKKERNCCGDAVASDNGTMPDSDNNN